MGWGDKKQSLLAILLVSAVSGCSALDQSVPLVVSSGVRAAQQDPAASALVSFRQIIQGQQSPIVSDPTLTAQGDLVIEAQLASGASGTFRSWSVTSAEGLVEHSSVGARITLRVPQGSQQVGPVLISAQFAEGAGTLSVRVDPLGTGGGVSGGPDLRLLAQLGDPPVMGAIDAQATLIARGAGTIGISAQLVSGSGTLLPVAASELRWQVVSQNAANQFVSNGVSSGTQTTGGQVSLNLAANFGLDFETTVLVAEVVSGTYAGAREQVTIRMSPPPADQVRLLNARTCQDATGGLFRISAPPYAGTDAIEIRASFLRQNAVTRGQQVYWFAPPGVRILDRESGRELSSAVPEAIDWVRIEIPAAQVGAQSSDVTITAEVWNGFSQRPRSSVRLQLPSLTGVWTMPGALLWPMQGAGCAI